MKERMQASLASAYKEFFECIEVDANTGVVKGPYLKFPSYPHVGSCYGEMRKVMIVGMDIGWDPEQNVIQSFENRRSSIEDVCLDQHNPHMSGTCVTAMHFLADQHKSIKLWSP